MKITPPRAPPAGMASTLTRLISGISLRVAKSTLTRLISGISLRVAKITLALTALASKLRPQTEQVTPIELYHCTWETASSIAYTIHNLKEWKTWEHKFDSQIKTNEDAIKLANEMLATIGDQYAILLSPAQVKAEQDRASGQFTGIGVQFEAKLDSAGRAVMAPDPEGGFMVSTDSNGYPLMQVVSGPAQQAGMQNGDAVVSINGETAKNITRAGLVNKLRCSAGEKIEIVILRDGQIRTINITAGSVNTEVVTCQVLKSSNGQSVGYIRLEHFYKLETASEMITAIKKLAVDKLIIDLRYNPGGDMDVQLQLASLFIKDGLLVSCRERTSSTSHELSVYSLNSKGLNINVKDEASGKYTNRHLERLEAIAADCEIAILVNGESMSAAEMFTAALQDNKRAIVIGETTFGKGIAQAVLLMPNGTQMRVTNQRYFTPNGRWLGDGGNSSESYGIVPDHIVKLEDKPDIILGSAHDNQLTYALETLANAGLELSQQITEKASPSIIKTKPSVSDPLTTTVPEAQA
ncbi:MAG: S41 family peptidase [Candidatus Obscuribacterales bacterium]